MADTVKQDKMALIIAELKKKEQEEHSNKEEIVWSESKIGQESEDESPETVKYNNEK